MNPVASINLPATDPGLRLTVAAQQHLRRALSKAGAPPPIGLRLGIKKAGCSGYEYVVEYAYTQKQPALDFVFEENGITFFVDKEHYLKFLKGGTVIDFRKEALQEGLHFDNPNVGNQCGCGESFTLREEG